MMLFILIKIKILISTQNNQCRESNIMKSNLIRI